ncbi:L-tyrosine/L-tryptophan isonitrile synthase family protein [Streptosporangium carneum]|uniref:L-tyrosine/L-tryptophan isonitrile synthase family protein n=1 Tax=Streptosporangium carneum TaxID=47481 RepID=UPI0031E9D290
MSVSIHASDIPPWEQLAESIRITPAHRLYLATLPTGASEPVPPHPAHPEGTLVVGMTALTEGEEGARLLREVIERRDPREGALAHFLDRLVRPTARVFRAFLDRHGRFPAEPAGLAYELSRERGATGRVVVTDPTFPEDPGRALAAIRSAAHRLGALFAAAGLGGVDESADAVRAAVDASLAAELRFLRPETYAALGGADNDLVHTVGPEQHAVLTETLERVAEQARRRRVDPAARQPAVVIDLDLCALDPRRRILHALRTVSGPRPGAPRGVTEFAAPERLAALPAYHGPSWELFVENTGLRLRYPGVDWDQMLTDYSWAFYRPWRQLAWDTPVAGLSRFVWDVHDAGGRVVFNTARRHRVREETEHALARAGILRPRLLMLPNDRVRPVHELKSENLRALADLEVITIFDDLWRNRQAMAKELPSARLVAVELAGFTSERPPGRAPEDGAPIITTFETVPRPLLVTGPALSHARSPAQLRIGEMSCHPVARDHAVRLTTPESLEIVDALVSAADAAADRTAENALRRGAETTVSLVHRVLTHERFLRGSREHLSEEAVRAFVERKEPLRAVAPGFSAKPHHNGLRTAGPLPDLAELGALVRLRELQRAVAHVYPPGLRITVLTDGDHYRSRPTATPPAYRDKLKEYLRLVADPDTLDLADVSQAVREHLGPEASRRRALRIEEHAGLLGGALTGIDVTAAPLESLERADRICRGLVGDRADGPPVPGFSTLFHSLVYSVNPPPPPPGTTPEAWARGLYADVFNVTDPAASPEAVEGRRAVLRNAWDDAVRRLTVLRVDGELGCEDTAFLPGRIRLTPSPRPGSLGFSYLGGSSALPWHGVGVVDAEGTLSVDYAVSLADQGFVPVHSPLLGPAQPWFTVPVTSTRLVDRRRGNELDPAFRSSVRLHTYKKVST